jgi:hypothetical protein
MSKRTIIETLHDALMARKNCIARARVTESENEAWQHHWESLIHAIELHALPSGAGFDNGTTVDLEQSTLDKIVFHTSYHHMNDVGFYNGWTEHTIRVYPAFDGIRLTISGPDRNEWKDYGHEVFHQCLLASVDEFPHVKSQIVASVAE